MNILVLYSTRTWPMRASQRDHLWAFKHYAAGARCYYLNLGLGGFPYYLTKVEFDLIIFDWSFVGGRVERARFQKTLQTIAVLRGSNAVKICMPQDEFTSMDLLCELINDFDISFVFSVAPPSEWHKIYRTVDFDKVKFVQVLTGYLDEAVVERWRQKATDSSRSLDIGYRTVSTAIWGRFNLLKATIAELFTKHAELSGLTFDIKVGAEHFKMGEEWLEFLAKCRFTLGVEGGSRILDWDGTVLAAVSNYLGKNPDATFDDLAIACVPAEREGEINVVAISPRHLEACLTRTGQVLVEGSYNGILKPNLHYIPLKSDFSNMTDVLDRMKDEPARLAMTESAFRDIVSSGKFTYRSMVETIFRETGLYKKNCTASTAPDNMKFLVNKAHLQINILLVYFLTRTRRARNWYRKVSSL